VECGFHRVSHRPVPLAPQSKRHRRYPPAGFSTFSPLAKIATCQRWLSLFVGSLDQIASGAKKLPKVVDYFTESYGFYVINEQKMKR
jgi:hypothetical protein